MYTILYRINRMRVHGHGPLTKHFFHAVPTLYTAGANRTPIHSNLGRSASFGRYFTSTCSTRDPAALEQKIVLKEHSHPVSCTI